MLGQMWSIWSFKIVIAFQFLSVSSTQLLFPLHHWSSCLCSLHSRPLLFHYLYWKLKQLSFGAITKLSESLPIQIADGCNLLGLLSFYSCGGRKFFPVCSSFITDKWIQICKASRSSQGWGWYSCELKKSETLITAGWRHLTEIVLLLLSHLIITFKLMSLSCKQIQSQLYIRDRYSQQQSGVD